MFGNNITHWGIYKLRKLFPYLKNYLACCLIRSEMHFELFLECPLKRKKKKDL